MIEVKVCLQTLWACCREGQLFLYWRYFLKRFNLKKSELAVVGDRLYTDMKMAHAAGITGILVLSGESKKENIKNLNADQKYYDYIFESVADIIKEL